MTDLFQYDDPISYLQDIITANKNVRGYISKLAAGAGCQVSYFSQFLRSKNQLSPDHAAGLSDFLGHSSLEAEYFLNLLLLFRASTPSLQKKLKKKIESLKDQQTTLSGRIKNKSDTKTVSLQYYSSWLYAAIHMALSISKYDEASTLAKRFDIPDEKAISILSALEHMGLILKHDGRWTLTTNLLHLPHNSEMTSMNHFLWRQRALFDVEKAKKDTVHYSSVFTMSEKDVVKLKSHILDFIENLRSEIQLSPPEEVFCFNLDFFKV